MIFERMIEFKSDFFPRLKFKTQLDEITDSYYLNFLKNYSNGGFFFGQALLLYPHIERNEYPNIMIVNKALKVEYKELFNDLIAFGQDLFGCQFCFNTKNNNIVLFNAEDGRTSYLASNFDEWITIILEDFDYYTGFTYYQEWCKENGLKTNQRIVGKKPFIIGGEYELSNFVVSEYPRFIEYYGVLANYLHDLPDGTPVTIRYSE